MRSLPESFCRLQQLEHLQLSGCKMLSSLPSRFGDLTNLRYPDLSGCSDLKNLPVSFRNLSLLQHLNLKWCTKLMLEPDVFQNITELEFLNLNGCWQLEELPCHITYQASLRMLKIGSVKRLREVPIEIGELGRLRKLKIGSDLLISLPNSLGRLSLLTHLMIVNCPRLEYLPSSLEHLSSLTHLTIHCCPKIRCLLFSVRCLPLLEDLGIYKCPIEDLDFGTASLSFPSSNLKQATLWKTEVFRISIAEEGYPRFESLKLIENDHLREIKALPVSLKCLDIWRNPELVVLSSFARLTSLRELRVRECGTIEKIDGLKDCIGLEKLSVETSGELLGIESLEQLQNLRTLELRANKASAIVSCIQTIKKCPDQITVCTRAVPDATSVLLDSSILSSNVFVVDSLRLKTNDDPPESPFSEEMKSLFNNSSMNDNAMMLSFVINSAHSSQVQIELVQAPSHARISSMFVSEGRWAVIGVFTRRCTWLTASVNMYFVAGEKRYGSWSRVEDVELERSLGVGGEEQRLVEAFLPLLQSISN